MPLILNLWLVIYFIKKYLLLLEQLLRYTYLHFKLKDLRELYLFKIFNLLQIIQKLLNKLFYVLENFQ